MTGGARELTILQITAVASDSVLARIVVLIGSRGGRIRELRCTVEPTGVALIRTVVETAPGRGCHLATSLERVVDVIRVDGEGARCASLSTM